MATVTRERPVAESGHNLGDEGLLGDLVEGLNEDLAGELQAVIMYLHYPATLTGPYRKELRALFQAEIADEQSRALGRMGRVTSLPDDQGNSTLGASVMWIA